MLQNIKFFLLSLLKPIQVLMQRLGRAESKITKTIVDHCLMMLEPGDIILTHENQRLTSLFIKGYFDHAAIVTSKFTIMEAVGDNFENGMNFGGVREIPIEEFLYKKDAICIIRPTFSKTIRLRAGANAYKWKGLNYDYKFSLKAADVYCSELVYLCYNTEVPSFMAEIRPEVKEILPEAYINPKINYLKVLFNSKES